MSVKGRQMSGRNWVLLGVVVLVALGWFFFPEVVSAWNAEGIKAGEFGDQFGALNTLFTGLAFALLIYATILQSKELRLQREELEETREEFRIQSGEFRKQTEIQDRHLALLKEERERREAQWKAENRPKILVSEVVKRHTTIRVFLVNVGSAAIGVRLLDWGRPADFHEPEVYHQTKKTKGSIKILQSEHVFSVLFTANAEDVIDGIAKEHFKFSITFRDRFDDSYEIPFKLDLDRLEQV